MAQNLRHIQQKDCFSRFQDINTMAQDKITIINFSNVYKEEKFYNNTATEWIDCSDISGADCFCDNEATDEIRRRLKDVNIHGLHFIDSGNYHYISRFLTDKINETFTLLVFDHHPDMQPPLFEQMLTCGDWVKSVLDTNQNVDKVVLVGASDQLIDRIPEEYATRMICFPESQLNDRQAWQTFYDMHLNHPIYISVDKDVLSPNDDTTNWDQGIATLPQLKQLLVTLLRHNRLIGVDICGECDYSIRGLLDKNIRENDHVNKELLNVVGSYTKRNGKIQ